MVRELMVDSGFLDREFKGSKYQVFVPPGGGKGLPTILFLHGRGESGKDGVLQTANALGSSIRYGRERWPFLVVFPQKPTFEKLWPQYKEMLNGILREVDQEFEPDSHKRYITGLSQGGNGTFRLAGQLIWQFAAAAPICGWCDPKEAVENLKGIPTWAFHGGKDNVVPPSGSERAVEALKEAGENAKLTIYPEANHNSWDRAYAEKGLPGWFLGHSLD